MEVKPDYKKDSDSKSQVNAEADIKCGRKVLKEEAKDCNFLISIELTIFETKIPMLLIGKSVHKTRLPPIVTVFTLVPKAISISTKSSLGIPGGAKVKESFVAQKTPA